MYKLKRNQVVISTLVVMIGVAGYLNYIDTKNVGQPIMLDDNGEIIALIPSGDEEISIMSDENPSISVVSNNVNNEEEAKPGEAVFVNSSTDTSYFVQAKLDREQARSKEKDILMELVNSDSIDSEKKSEVADEILEIQKRIEKETAAEAMIESKGFNGVYVRIDDNTVDVVVNKSELTDAEIAQIQDIVSRKTGLEADKIRINTIKK